MERVIVDDATRAKFVSSGGQVEICDASGEVLGYFLPVTARSLYEGVVPPISNEELRRRSKKGGGRPLADILTDLE